MTQSIPMDPKYSVIKGLHCNTYDLILKDFLIWFFTSQATIFPLYQDWPS